MTFFNDILNLLIDLFNALMTFGTYIFDFLSFEIGFADLKISVGAILFGGGFTAWIIYKALPST